MHRYAYIIYVAAPEFARRASDKISQKSTLQSFHTANHRYFLQFPKLSASHHEELFITHNRPLLVSASIRSLFFLYIFFLKIFFFWENAAPQRVES